MAKNVPGSIIDLMLEQAEGTRIHVCSGEPANYAGIDAVELAAANITGSYTKANGDVSGRKNTLPTQPEAPITASGAADHVVVSDGSTTLKLVTTCPSQALTEGGTVDIASFAHEIRQAT